MSKVIETAVAKFAVAFVAVAMLVSFVAPVASAQTTEDLQAMINDLLAQVASLQGQLGGSSSAAGVCPFTWTRSLNVGDSGADVKALQQFLNADDETRVSASGVGSAGQESDYYGSLTGSAVAKFQTKYRSEILTPLGLVNATTYFGPATMAQANKLCASAMTDDSSSDDSSDDSSSDDSSSDDSDNAALSGTEASLEGYNLKDGDESTVSEGQEDAPVAVAEFDVEDGDIKVQRVDVSVDPAATNDVTKPWKTFETVSLWVDGDMVAEMDASDEDNWEVNKPNTGDYRARFTGLDLVFRDGDQAEITVAVSVMASVDLGTNDLETWEVFVPTDGIRGRDGAGVDQYTGLTSDTASFDIEAEGANDELIVKASTNDPDSTTLQLDDTKKSDWMTVFIFDLDTDDSTSDIELNTLRVDVDGENAAGADLDTVHFINDARLVVNGESYDDVTITHATATSNFVFAFDNNEFVIDAGDRQEVEFQLEFKAMSSTTLEGATVQATVAGANATAEGADDITPSGSSTGDEHTLRTSGAIMTLVSVDETFVENSDASTSDNEGTFVIVFDVTAFEQDVFVDDTAAEASVATNEGVKFQVFTGGTATTAGTASANLDSDATLETGYFRVSEGETERFTLTVDYDPALSGFYKVGLYSVQFNSTATTQNTEQLANPATDYDTDALSI